MSRRWASEPCRSPASRIGAKRKTWRNARIGAAPGGRPKARAGKILRRQGELRFGENDFLAALTAVTESASSIHDAASACLANARLDDPGLAKAAAGAASQACHQAALASLAAAGPTHAFALKFRLFAAGRWPLGIVRTRRAVF